MLRLCLTLSVLLGLQVAGTGANKVVEEACKSMMCYPLTGIVDYGTYEEQSDPEVQWLATFINGADFKTAIVVALSKFYEYAQSSNAADTIVPISFPLAVFVPYENGAIKQEYAFFIYLPLEVQSPPNPKDPSVSVFERVPQKAYVRTYQEITEDYERLAIEFKNDLEKDQRSFYEHEVYITWFNLRGLFQIAFVEK